MVQPLMPDAPRLRLWLTLTNWGWYIALAGTLLYAVLQYSAIAFFLEIFFHPDKYDTTTGTFLAGFFSNLYEDIKPSFFFHLWLTGWAVAALVKIRPLLRAPDQWVEFRAFAWLLICAAAILGFPLAALVYEGMDALPAGWIIGIIRLLIGPLLLPFAGLITLSGLVAAAKFATFAFKYLFLHMPIELFEYLNNRDVEKHVIDQKKQGLAQRIQHFNMWLSGITPPNIPDESKGARMATPQEVAAIHQDVPESMAFGHYDGQPLLLKTDKHVLIMASTRSGKGVTLIIPHLLRYRGSAFVLDPKAENTKATWRQRVQLNDTVHVLDPFGISGRPGSRFNPLSRFTPETMEAESKALAAAIFVTGDRERDHWVASGQQLLATLILYVYLSPAIPPGKKDLPNVRRILLGALQKALDDMSSMTEADGLLAALALSFMRTPEKEFGSIVSTAQRQTEILDNPAMIACLSATGPGPEVDFKEWHTGTMTVYLCLSATKFPTFNRWLRLVLTSALDEMTDTLNPPKLPVCFMLDELATLGHLPAVSNAVGLAAGYGIQLVSVFQDVAQMRDLYKGRWASFIGNAGVRALFNLDDHETAEYWSKFIGARIAETHGRQEDQFGLSRGQNVGETMRQLFPPDRLMMEFAANKMLVLAQGQRPIVTDRVAYFADDGLDGLWDDPRNATLQSRV